MPIPPDYFPQRPGFDVVGPRNPYGIDLLAGDRLGGRPGSEVGSDIRRDVLTNRIANIRQNLRGIRPPAAESQGVSESALGNLFGGGSPSTLSNTLLTLQLLNQGLGQDGMSNLFSQLSTGEFGL